MRIRRVLLFAVAGIIAGGAGGLLLPSFSGRVIESFDFRVLAHLALLGAMLAAAGPIIERHWRKLAVSVVVGAVTMVALAVGIMGVAHIETPWFVGVGIIVLASAIFPAVVALADCLADEDYRAIIYETLFSALGGALGLAATWPLLSLQNDRLRVALVSALYGGVIWFMMAVGKWEEESEERLEAEETGKIRN